MMAVVVFLLVLSFLIFIHELGHFIVARWAGIEVEEFGFGYPPQAVKLFKWKGTVFSLNWIPFGGFVRMKGEEPHPRAIPQKGEFYHVGANKRMAVILSGVIANFVFGVLAFTLVFGRLGIPQEIKEARISQIALDSPADSAQIPENVNLLGLKIDGQLIQTQTVDSVIEVINQHRGQEVTVVTSGPCLGLICSDSINEYPAYLRLEDEIPEGQGSLGVAFDPIVYVFYPAWQMPIKSSVYGMKEALTLGQLILQVLKQTAVESVTKGRVPSDIAGPVGIVHQAQTSGLFERGWLSILSFAGMLSINLATVNILPLPPLDGGRAMFVIVEKIVGRYKSRWLERYLNYGGYVILMALIVMITARDIWRVIAS
ncbi:MAG: M50 family metallopeptidase [Patescibacteria group bacterium]